MTIVRGYFDKLHFSECKIYNIEIVKDDLVVSVKSELEIYPPHPLANEHNFLEPCKVLFKNIKRLEKKFTRWYPGSGRYEKESNIVTECNPESGCALVYEEYGIEGFLLNPPGWLDVKIIAEDFYFDDLKD